MFIFFPFFSITTIRIIDFFSLNELIYFLLGFGCSSRVYADFQISLQNFLIISIFIYYIYFREISTPGRYSSDLHNMRKRGPDSIFTSNSSIFRKISIDSIRGMRFIYSSEYSCRTYTIDTMYVIDGIAFELYRRFEKKKRLCRKMVRGFRYYRMLWRMRLFN